MDEGARVGLTENQARTKTRNQSRRSRVPDGEFAPPQPICTSLLALANAGNVRCEILFVLAKGPMNVGAIANEIDLDKPRISQHLYALREAGLFLAKYVGGCRMYAIAGSASVVRSEISAEGLPPAVKITGTDSFSIILEDHRGVRSTSKVEVRPVKGRYAKPKPE